MCEGKRVREEREMEMYKKRQIEHRYAKVMYVRAFRKELQRDAHLHPLSIS